MRRLEPTGIEVEGPQTASEVDVHPFTPGAPSLLDCDRNDPLPDALVAGTLGDHRVLNPRMHEPIPRHVHEPDQRTALPVPRYHPSEAVRVQLLGPVPL